MKNLKKIIGLILLTSFFVLAAFQYLDTNPAVDFLNSLDAEQREKTQLAFDDESKEIWHFFPGKIWPRPGVQLSELNSNQRDLLFKLLRTNLSETGYNKTRKIMDLENVLLELGDNVHMRDAEKYHVTFYGDPTKDKLWAWSYEGHHVSLNFTNLNDKITIAPRFFGASPATIPSGKRKGERTLAKEEDLGLELILNMSSELRNKAIIQEKSFPDIVTSNSSVVEPLETVGIQMKELPKPLQKTMLTLIDTYLSNMPKDLAKKRKQQLKKEEFSNIYFAWAGATELGKGHYYRVQGKTFLIEFDNTQNNANHIHTVWRDFNGDFGRDLIKEHYHESHHSK